MREEAIRDAIKNLDGTKFELFARELLSRELYRGLNPTSRSHDKGEDARTEPSTIFLHEGIWISLLISKTCNWSKIEKDCNTCQKNNREINLIVFATSGNPNFDKVDEWKEKVKRKYGWDLEVRSIEFLAQYASRPQFEALVDDYLFIPPPGGDFINVIEDEFTKETDRAISQIRIIIPGIKETIHRNEVDWIVTQFREAKPVILHGEPGSGKSGIASLLAKNARLNSKIPLLLDARRVAYIHHEMGLRDYLGLKGPVAAALHRLGSSKNGCQLIIDQLDNLAGLPSATILTELAISCTKFREIDVIVISRTREGHEKNLLGRFTDAGFVELKSYLLNESQVKDIFDQLGIVNPYDKLKELGKNLLNLELLGLLSQEKSIPSFDNVASEIDLWDYYFKTVIERDEVASNQIEAQSLFAEASKLAKISLQNEDGFFTLDLPIPYAIKRLISWEIVLQVEGRMYRFRHEELQSYCYARDATERCLLPRTVLTEIPAHRTRSVFLWMQKMYERNNSRFLLPFLKDVLHV